jgi:aspartate-semialdehyde dehydrogenase
MSCSHPSVAVVGATGVVGTELIACLERRRFPLRRLRLFASGRSAGRTLPYRGEALPVEALAEQAPADVGIALFCAGSAVSHRLVPPAVDRGTVVIDNSSAFRMDGAVPLVVPEVNADVIGTQRGVIANPNCVAIIAVVPLWPLHRAFRIRRIIASTYQAACGAGAAAMKELRLSTRAALAGEAFRPQVLRAHAVALTVEFERAITPEAARELLARAPGVRVVDDIAANHFPMPIEASGQGEVLVGRIRRDSSDSSDASGHSLALFLAGDQLLKDAALNAVQIAERLLEPQGKSAA